MMSRQTDDSRRKIRKKIFTKDGMLGEYSISNQFSD